VSCAERWGVVGVPFRDWPDWIKALSNEEHRVRRIYAEEDEWDAGWTFSDVPEAERLAYGDADDDREGAGGW
jgi:hypothetical protein